MAEHTFYLVSCDGYENDLCKLIGENQFTNQYDAI